MAWYISSVKDLRLCYPPTKMPFAIRDAVKRELDRLVARKAVVEVDIMDSRASINRMVIVEKQNAQTEFRKGLFHVIDAITTQIRDRFVALNSVAADFGFFNGNSLINTELNKLSKISEELTQNYSKDLNAHEFASEIESFKLQAISL